MARTTRLVGHGHAHDSLLYLVKLANGLVINLDGGGSASLAFSLGRTGLGACGVRRRSVRASTDPGSPGWRAHARSLFSVDFDVGRVGVGLSLLLGIAYSANLAFLALLLKRRLSVGESGEPFPSCSGHVLQLPGCIQPVEVAMISVYIGSKSPHAVPVAVAQRPIIRDQLRNTQVIITSQPHVYSRLRACAL